MSGESELGGENCSMMKSYTTGALRLGQETWAPVEMIPIIASLFHLITVHLSRCNAKAM